MVRFISVEIYGAVHVGKTRTALYKRISATGGGSGFHLSTVYVFVPFFFLSN